MNSIKVGNDSGGRDAINRILIAYNFSTRQQLCKHLGVAKSTMSNRYLRDSFPAEWIIQCAIETGVSLLWLTTGQGEMHPAVDNKNKSNNETRTTIKQVKIENGALLEHDEVFLDHSLISGEADNYLYVKTTKGFYLVDKSVKQVSNGYWLIDIDGMKNIVKIVRIPGNKMVVHQDESSFECSIDDIDTIGRAVKVIKSI
ncbi:phage repressor protein [Xenorhabdus beddingii]|uniref:Phage repressor protein n=1 Tax=Xenorhabdus beddingii TaxID=40578 RepID=A0A1Y2SHZ9_9GAMM|nr:phage repressor protein CI [Xenorhabdus beddingii]OTA17216.1 phage repressor protein [Xenorhabdus beddingii]